MKQNETNITHTHPAACDKHMPKRTITCGDVKSVKQTTCTRGVSCDKRAAPLGQEYACTLDCRRRATPTPTRLRKTYGNSHIGLEPIGYHVGELATRGMTCEMHMAWAGLFFITSTSRILSPTLLALHTNVKESEP